MDRTDPTRDVKLAAFSLVVIAGVVWLSMSLAHNNWKIYPDWNSSFQILMIATGVGSLAGEAVQVFKKKGPPDAPPEDPDLKP
jgi:hypothetical protein